MSSKHVGYPVPTEMWNSMEKEEVDYAQEESIDYDLFAEFDTHEESTFAFNYIKKYTNCCRC